MHADRFYIRLRERRTVRRPAGHSVAEPRAIIVEKALGKIAEELARAAPKFTFFKQFLAVRAGFSFAFQACRLPACAHAVGAVRPIVPDFCAVFAQPIIKCKVFPVSSHCFFADVSYTFCIHGLFSIFGDPVFSYTTKIYSAPFFRKTGDEGT